MSYHVASSKAFINALNIPSYQPGKLSDLTFVAKDLIDITGFVTGAGNPTWAKTQAPAVAHAICVEQLLGEGATCVGKTVTGELAFDLLGHNHHYGTPINPKAPDRVPGGSSSGSASAVACGLVDFALGTDTGGSVRVPASYCGVWGYRPSHGRISLAGVRPLGPSFDTVGVLAKNEDILRRASSVLLGIDLSQNTVIPETIYLLEDMVSICDSEVRDAVTAALKSLSDTMRIQSITLSDIAHRAISYEWLAETYNQLQWSEILSTYGTWLAQYKPNLGPITATNFDMARTAVRSQLPKHSYQREWFAQTINQFLGSDKLICIPTTPTIAPLLNDNATDRRQGTHFPRTLALNAIAGLARLPQITAPGLQAAGNPIGLSLLAAHGNDSVLLKSILPNLL